MTDNTNILVTATLFPVTRLNKLKTELNT